MRFIKMTQNDKYNCPFCGQGQMQTKIIDYEIRNAVNDKTVIPKIEIDICDTCGEKLFGYKATLKLEEFKNKEDKISLQLRPELKTRISDLAKKHKRSFNDEINSILEASLS